MSVAGAIKEIELFRGKYIKQSIITFIVFMVIIGGMIFFNGFNNEDYFFLILLVAVGVLMAKSINYVWQSKAEEIIFNKLKNMLVGIKIDFDNGIKKSVMNKLNMVPLFSNRQTFNVMVGDNFKVYEELLYDEVDVKVVKLKNVKFEGIVVEIENKNYEGVGSFIKNGKNFGFGVGTNKSFMEQKFKLQLLQLLKIFGAKSCFFEVLDDRLYIFIKTGNKLFHQFSLLKKVDVNIFITKALMLKEFIIRFEKEVNN